MLYAWRQTGELKVHVSNNDSVEYETRIDLEMHCSIEGDTNV